MLVLKFGYFIETFGFLASFEKCFKNYSNTGPDTPVGSNLLEWLHTLVKLLVPKVHKSSFLSTCPSLHNIRKDIEEGKTGKELKPIVRVGIEKGHVSMAMTHFEPQYTFKLKKGLDLFKTVLFRDTEMLHPALVHTGCVMWNELLNSCFCLEIRPVSWSLVVMTITVKHLESRSPTPTQLLKVVLRGRIELSSPRIPVGQGKHVPFPKPTSHTNNCTWHPTVEHSSFVLLVYWPRELDTHTQCGDKYWSVSLKSGSSLHIELESVILNLACCGTEPVAFPLQHPSSQRTWGKRALTYKT